MHQYTRVFGVTRIPAVPHDWNTASVHPAKSKHITVICRNNFYHVDVLAEDGTGLPLEDIERALYEIVADARKADGPAVGVLTSDGRDEWARAREHLLTSPTNAASMRSIEDSLFNVSLDSDVLTLPSDHAGAPHSATPDSVDAHARNTSGAGRGGHNRWFDKAMSLVVEPNGRAGLMGEHSPCDALIPSIVIDFCLGVPSPKPHEAFPSVPQTAEKGSGKGVKWSKLAWEVDAQTETNIATASEAARKIAAGSDIGMLWYDEYGAEWIKKVGKQSPDAYLQLVLQVAFANVKGRQSPTYETASTRLYRHGRTDVIRSFSKESYEFVKGLRDGLSTKELYPLLSKATQAHNAQTRSSSMGKGIDRHLTGLRLVYDSQEDGPVPESEEKHVDSWKGAQLLFNDPLLAQSQTWKLSTSGLSAGDRFAGTGFGAGYPDGYGINCEYLLPFFFPFFFLFPSPSPFPLLTCTSLPIRPGRQQPAQVWNRVKAPGPGRRVGPQPDKDAGDGHRRCAPRHARHLRKGGTRRDRGRGQKGGQALMERESCLLACFITNSPSACTALKLLLCL